MNTDVIGHPALNIPISNGLPVGMQLVGRHFEEDKILKIANSLQKLI
ncbi:MAG: hypothetical protein QXE55_02480 [Saccharolobus sp.]